MRYLALAADYDGTLATRGQVGGHVLRALDRLLASGRKLIMVTGRELDELQIVFPHLQLFHRVVAENGAWLYRPATHEERGLAPPPPAEFVVELQRRGVSPLSVGRSIVATREPHENTVLEVIRDLGLELQVIFNKGAVMVLPAGVNKATGLTAALRELELSPHNVVGVGDAENDHAFLTLCECAVAVSNALPTLKERADWVTKADHGEGVVELIEALLRDDLTGVESRLTRHHVLLGTTDEGEEVRLPPYGPNLLITGSSGSGKSTLATGLLERLSDGGYQFCIIDPEGDYESFNGAVVLGDSQRVPTVHEILQLLENPEARAVVNLLGVPLQDRPAFFAGLLPHLQELRARTGRPHWIVVDETHHLLPASWDPAALAMSQELSSMVFITVHPDQLARPVQSAVDSILMVGGQPDPILKLFTDQLGRAVPPWTGPALQAGQALYWSAADPRLLLLRIAGSRTDRRRHRRKYAKGELPPDRSFYFTGAEGRLHLRAQNLMLFLQIAEGVDDETWMYHLRRGDYSQWFRERIKDDALAERAARVETTPGITAQVSRSQIKAAIEENYTLPASGLTGGGALGDS